MSDETIKVNVEGNADKKLDDVGKAAKKSAASVEGMGTAFKFIAAFAAIDKIKQAYTAYVGSGVKGSAELKEAVDEVGHALQSLAETKSFRELVGSLSFVLNEAAKASQSAAEGNWTYERSLKNADAWLNRLRISVNSYFGESEHLNKLKEHQLELDDQIEKQFGRLSAEEQKRRDQVRKSAEVSKQRNAIEAERLKIIMDLEAKQKSEEIANTKSLQQIKLIQNAINEELDTRSRAAQLTADHQARLLSLLRQTAEQEAKLVKIEAERLKQAEAVAKAINAANKQAIDGLDEFAELAGDIHDIMSKRQWAQIRLNNLQEADMLTAEEQAKLQEKINDLAAKENMLRRSKLESIKAIAEVENGILKTLQDAGDLPDDMADRLNNAEKIRDAIDEQLQLVRNLVAASKNQNIQEDERKKLVEQAKAEQEKLVALLAHREKFAKNMVEQMGRLKQQADEAAKALDDAFRDRTKQQGNEQQLDPRNMLNAQQQAKLQRDIRNQARKDARERALAVDEQTADDIKDMRNRGAGADEIAKRQRQGNIARRNIFKELNRGEGESFRNAVAEQTKEAVGGVIRNLQDRQQIDAQEARILEVQTDRLTELEKGNAIMKQRLDAIEAANRRAAMPNFRGAGRLN